MSKTVMRRAAALILLTSAAAFADVAAPQAAATVDDFGAPRVILTSFGYETGFTYLIFALYEHGRVAYPVPRDWSGEHYLTATLSADEERTLLANLPLNRIGSLHPSQRNGADGSNDCIHSVARRSARAGLHLVDRHRRLGARRRDSAGDAAHLETAVPFLVGARTTLDAVECSRRGYGGARPAMSRARSGALAGNVADPGQRDDAETSSRRQLDVRSAVSGGADAAASRGLVVADADRLRPGSLRERLTRRRQLSNAGPAVSASLSSAAQQRR